MKSFRRSAGFTLIELMIIIVIIGLLASVAVQGYHRFMKQSKASEVPLSMKQIVHGEIIYFAGTHTDKNKDHKTKAPHFRALVATPSNPPCSNGSALYPKNSGVWDANGWARIQFAMTKAHYYQYQVEATGTATSATFTITAKGNLDCDSDFSTFRIYGDVAKNGEPTVQGMVVANELE